MIQTCCMAARRWIPRHGSAWKMRSWSQTEVGCLGVVGRWCSLQLGSQWIDRIIFMEYPWVTRPKLTHAPRTCLCAYDHIIITEFMTHPGKQRSMRVLYTGISKKNCVRKKTFDELLAVLTWDLEHLATGKRATCRHDGTPWHASDCHRAQTGNRMISTTRRIFSNKKLKTFITRHGYRIMKSNRDQNNQGNQAHLFE